MGHLLVVPLLECNPAKAIAARELHEAEVIAD